MCKIEGKGCFRGERRKFGHLNSEGLYAVTEDFYTIVLTNTQLFEFGAISYIKSLQNNLDYFVISHRIGL
ncbi:hypothetical protein ACU8KH_00974 [Lachancea thermotolerans]